MFCSEGPKVCPEGPKVCSEGPKVIIMFPFNDCHFFTSLNSSKHVNTCFCLKQYMEKQQGENCVALAS